MTPQRKNEGGNHMNRECSDIIKLIAVIAILIGALVAAILLVVKFREEIGDFFAALGEKLPPPHREEDDYADEELNSLYDMEEITQ